MRRFLPWHDGRRYDRLTTAYAEDHAGMRQIYIRHRSTALVPDHFQRFSKNPCCTPRIRGCSQLAILVQYNTTYSHQQCVTKDLNFMLVNISLHWTNRSRARTDLVQAIITHIDATELHPNSAKYQNKDKRPNATLPSHAPTDAPHSNIPVKVISTHTRCAIANYPTYVHCGCVCARGVGCAMATRARMSARAIST